MDIKSIILGFLTYESMTGYELKKYFSISFSFISGISYGSIYPALKKMEHQGLVTMQLEVQDGAPNRKVYTITKAGKAAFLNTLKAPLSFGKFKSPFLMRLFFFANLSPEERVAAVRTHLESIMAMQQDLETASPDVDKYADHFQHLCFEFGQRYFNDLAQNISKVIEALEQEVKGETEGM